MNKYTPGPWKIVKGMELEIEAYDCQQKKQRLVSVILPLDIDADYQCSGERWEEAIANAQLISAAPLLLEAAKKAQKARYSPHDSDLAIEADQAINQAIRIAEGAAQP